MAVRGHPIAPTEFLKARSAAAFVRSPEGRPRDWGIRASSGGYRTAGHVPKDGYRPRLTPRNLMKILAKGQSSTDLIMTESHRGISVFGYRCPRRARVLGYTQIGIVRRPFVRRYGARQVWIGDAPRGRSQNETKGGGGNHRESPSIAEIQQPTRPLVKG